MERTIRRNTQFEILTPTGWSDFDGISKQITHRLIQIICGEESLKCSYDHLILTEVGLREANQIQVGERIYNKFKQLVTVDAAILLQGDFEVYDPLEVKAAHQFISGPFVSHNCSFIGSSNTLIMGWKLEQLKASIVEPLADLDHLLVYEQPIKNAKLIDYTSPVSPQHKYVLVADVSRGKGLDYSAFNVFDVTAIPYRQVASYRCNEITPTDYASIIYKTAQFYNEALVLTEINDIGEQVGTVLLEDLCYEHVLCSEGSGRGGKKLCYNHMKADKGIRTTTPLKMSGCLLLKLLLEQNKMILVDEGTINELLVFVKSKNSYKADVGYHDDLAMTLVIFSWLSDQEYFKENYELNTMMSMAEINAEKLEEDMLPFGYLLQKNNDLLEEFSHIKNMNLPFNPFREKEIWQQAYDDPSVNEILVNSEDALTFFFGKSQVASYDEIVRNTYNK